MLYFYLNICKHVLDVLSSWSIAAFHLIAQLQCTVTMSAFAIFFAMVSTDHTLYYDKFALKITVDSDDADLHAI